MIQTILALMKKELYQVIRDRNMLRLIFISPIIQLLVLGYAINTDVKKIDTAVYDFDRSSLSREYIKAKTAGDYFVISSENPTVLDAELGFELLDDTRPNIVGPVIDIDDVVFVRPGGLAAACCQCQERKPCQRYCCYSSH